MPSGADPSVADAIRAIDWSRYETAYGSANRVGEQLLALFDSPPRSMEAASWLWGALCHQRAYVSSAALPALPFILQALEQADPELQVEILDILLGFASCSWPRGEHKAPRWKHLLFDRLSREAARIHPLTESDHVDIKGFAEDILSALERPPVWCVIANVVQERSFGPQGADTRSGTRAFRAGAKVHIVGAHHGTCETVVAIGRYRGSNRYSKVVTNVRHLENFRHGLAYSPAVRRLAQEEPPGASGQWSEEEAREMCAELERWKEGD